MTTTTDERVIGRFDPGRHEWQRLLPAWHCVFALLVVMTLTLTAIDDGLTPGRRWSAGGVVAGLGLAYVTFGARALREGPGPAANRYLLAGVPLAAVLFALAPVGAVMLFLVFPHVWILQPMARAIPVTLALDAGITGISVARAGAHGQAWAGWVLVGGLSLFLALLLGIWISRVIAQSAQRAELIAELARTREQLESLGRGAGAAAERERMAAEIHDTLAQGFAGVLILLDAVEPLLVCDPPEAGRLLDQARSTVQQNLAEARALVAGLTPPDLDGTSLPQALHQIVARTGPGGEPGVDLSVTGAPYGLPAEQEVALLRAAQEALTNARRHSGASRVAVLLAYTPDMVRLQVRDDGQGFDQAAPTAGFGLAAMHARAAQVGGVLTILTAPGAGVDLRFDLPVVAA